jgi:hypothetical protein
MPRLLSNRSDTQKYITISVPVVVLNKLCTVWPVRGLNLCMFSQGLVWYRYIRFIVRFFISILMYQVTVESVFCFRDVLICPDADPALLFSDFQEANKKVIFFSHVFFAYFFPKAHLHQSQEIKSYRVLRKRNPDPDPYKGSGSGRLKNSWIQNTGRDDFKCKQ